MRARLIAIATLLACGGGDGSGSDAGLGDGQPLDAPEMGPMITSFVPSPNQVAPGVPTDITWTWTYAVNPTIPEPTCEIDNGVGPVTRGQATSVTLSGVTTFTLTCTNRAGMASRQVVVSVPPVAPQLATFTISPSTIAVSTPTTLTFSWTYTTPPSPAPTCIVEHGVGQLAPGGTASVTLPQARTYRLRCTNSRGTTFADAPVAVNECASPATNDCQANATCVDTPDSYVCECKAGFTGNGDTCSAQAACGATPQLCSPNASCVGGTSCVCAGGYVGDGLTCTKLPFTFVTSTTGGGNISTWTGSNGQVGLAAADAVCASRAAAASLQGTYVAWMSDATSDAYCRVHGLTGKKANNCGLGSLPIAAGPWTRVNGTPVAPRIDRLLAPTRQTFAMPTNEFGAEISTSFATIYTGTDDSGVYAGAACNDWTTSVSAIRGAAGEMLGGGTTWTDAFATDPTCDTTGRIRCMEVGAGPALPSRHQVTKKAFLSSVSGNGNLSTWPDADGATGIAAADAICQARARFAGYASPSTFKAWMSSSTSATSRFQNSGTWTRPDGVLFGTSEADLNDGRLTSALYQTETNAYLAGTADTGAVWTGTSTSGSATFVYCSQWTSTSSSGTIGRHDLADGRWVSSTSQSCTVEARLYCLQD